MFLGAMLPDLSKWFNTSEIDAKREEIAMLIQKIAQENNSSSNIRFPRIKFPPKNKVSEFSSSFLRDNLLVVLYFQIVISDDDDDGDDDDDEDKPLRRPQSRSSDPRLRKKGSLGELLASKSNARANRFKGSYRDPSPPRSPQSASPSSIRSPKLFESPQVCKRSQLTVFEFYLTIFFLFIYRESHFR